MAESIFSADKSKHTGDILEMLLQQRFKENGYMLDSIRLVYRGYDWLVITSLQDKDKVYWAGFSSGETAASALRSLYAKLTQGELKLSMDKWKNNGQSK